MIESGSPSPTKRGSTASASSDDEDLASESALAGAVGALKLEHVVRKAGGEGVKMRDGCGGYAPELRPANSDAAIGRGSGDSTGLVTKMRPCGHSPDPCEFSPPPGI
jgi:hypothetical protein